MNITVYLGANEGNDPALHKAVTELGAWIGQSGNTLVYGGSKSGLMGALADSVVGNIIVQLQMRKTDAEPYYRNCLVPAQR